MSSRIYVVNLEKTTPGSNPVAYLVRASSAGQAIRHVTKPLITCHVAGQGELVNLLGSGVKVEEAGDEKEGSDAR